MEGKEQFDVVKLMDRLNEILCSYPGIHHKSSYIDVDALALFTGLLIVFLTRCVMQRMGLVAA